MRKLGVFFMGVVFSFAFAYKTTTLTSVSAECATVYVGGMSAGFTLKTDGAQIIGLSEVVTEKGAVSPALQAGIKTGDVIRKVGGIKVHGVGDLNEIVNKSKGKELVYEVERGADILQFQIKAVKERQTERYKIGVLVRESVSGIGTVTYIDKTTGRFGALGHAVVGENNREMSISNGFVYECSIVGVNKGIRGKAGELRGMFLSDKHFGNAEKLCNCGIFGQISDDFSVNGLFCAVADSQAVQPGYAYIYSTVNGVCPEKYTIEIVKVDKNNKENKNYVIKITD
jgi:stage IV sporulation protein B